MSDDVFAMPGERVMDKDTGKVICKVKNPLRRHEVVSAANFHEFEPGEQPWVPCTPTDSRCTRLSAYYRGPLGVARALQTFIEGEWRP